MSMQSDGPPASGCAPIYQLEQRVRLERVRLMANSLQLIAVCIVVASIVAPLFNPAAPTSVWSYVGAGAVAALLEIAALYVIGYAKP